MGFVSRGRPPVGEASCRSASAQMRAESALHELYETGSGDRSHLSRSLRQSADHRRLRRSQRLLNRVWLRPGATKSTAPSSASRTCGEGLPSGRIQDKPALLRVREQLGLVREPGRRAPVWHVKRCSFCRNGRGAPLTRHRDLNAAANILDIYLGLAKLGKRPSGFARPRPEKKRVAPTLSGSEHPHGNQTRRVRTRLV